ncbi:MAG TPA: DNA mismatch repair endonuclease MutL [Ktedonobacterales bacterium]
MSAPRGGQDGDTSPAPDSRRGVRWTPVAHPIVPRPTAHPIAPLPPEVVERIAAGEVIERPASVVRELLDNALDAGATSIRVELREGGRALIRIADDGAGIAAADLDLACQPHATSKIAALADLERVTTLGFRGEALASIAAVAALEIVTATGNDGLAAALMLAPDTPPAHTARSRTRGTTVTVRDLFAAVPARLAVLRGRQAEAHRALAVVRAHALARPDVRFTAVADGQLALQTPGGTLEDALAALYTSDLARTAIPLGPVATDDGVSLSGAVSPRGISFTTREHIVLAVNGRVVANPALAQAAGAGYGPLLRKGRHPLLVVHLSVPADAVDANVHPAKLHVLLRDEPVLARRLRDAVAEALGRSPASIATGSGESRNGVHPAPHFTRPVQLTLPAPHRRRGLLLGERRPRYSPLPPPSPDAPAQGPLALEPLGQFERTLILARTPTGDLYLVDQHRAHERVLYDRLSASREHMPNQSSTGESDDLPAAVSGQYLLDPLLVELTPRQAELLAPRVGELAVLGIECQPFGGSVFLVRALPAVAGTASDPQDVASTLARAAEDADDWLEHVRASLACRTAIKRGDPLTPIEQAALLTDLCASPAPAVCPHGSPILLRYSREYLTRIFEW